MTSVAEIKKYCEKYPFNEQELEIIIRCHNSIVYPKHKPESGTTDFKHQSFLSLLSHSFPYVFFFLPNDEIQNRITLVEDIILPQGFGQRLKKAIYPVKGIESDSEAIETLVRGISHCCGGDSENTLGVIFDCCLATTASTTTGESSSGETVTVDPFEIVQLCYRISIAAEVLVSPTIDKAKVITAAQEQSQLLRHHGLTKSLTNTIMSLGKEKENQRSHTHTHNLSRKAFQKWGIQCVPHIGSTLTAFMYNLIFHGKSFHSQDAVFENPQLCDKTSVFKDFTCPLDLFAITCMSPDLGGKWNRIFTSDKLDCYLPPSTSSLETAMKQQVGPSIFVIKIADNHLIGGCSESGMKFGYFLFEIEPFTRIHRSLGATNKYFIKHDIKTFNEHGEELSGTGFFADHEHMPSSSSVASSKHSSTPSSMSLTRMPQLFISEHFHWCKGIYLDVPFSSKVEAFEVWGIDVPQKGSSAPGMRCTTWVNPWKRRFP